MPNHDLKEVVKDIIMSHLIPVNPIYELKFKLHHFYNSGDMDIPHTCMRCRYIVELVDDTQERKKWEKDTFDDEEDSVKERRWEHDSSLELDRFQMLFDKHKMTKTLLKVMLDKEKDDANVWCQDFDLDVDHAMQIPAQLNEYPVGIIFSYISHKQLA